MPWNHNLVCLKKKTSVNRAWTQFHFPLFYVNDWLKRLPIFVWLHMKLLIFWAWIFTWMWIHWPITTVWVMILLNLCNLVWNVPKIKSTNLCKWCKYQFHSVEIWQFSCHSNFTWNHFLWKLSFQSYWSFWILIFLEFHPFENVKNSQKC